RAAAIPTMSSSTSAARGFISAAAKAPSRRSIGRMASSVGWDESMRHPGRAPPSSRRSSIVSSSLRAPGCSAARRESWSSDRHLTATGRYRRPGLWSRPMRALDEIYAAEDLARLYDHFNGWGASDDFYLDLALKAGGPVLDLGCGTGMLACRIAAEGLTVVGVEPSRSMLAIARARPGAELVEWVRSDAESLRLAQRFDL